MLFKENNIYVSVVVCTLNRCGLLTKCLQSLIKQSADGCLYELIVVDNGSSDKTRYEVEKINLKNICYVYEPVGGLSNARNTGILNSKGNYIAFIDDDAIADFYWIENIISTFQNVVPVPSVIGGAIDLFSEIELPVWHTASCRASLGYLNYGKAGMFLENGTFLFGGNIAFDRVVFDKFQFNPNLGRKENNLLSYEETFLQKEIIKDGGKIFYSPNIKIKHFVPLQRMRFAWHVKRHFWQGVSKSIVAFNLEKREKRLLLKTLKSLLKNFAKCILYRFIDRKKTVYFFFNLIDNFGFLFGALK